MVAAVALALPPILLVFIQPDIGSALVYVAALFALLFVAGVRWSHLAVIGAIAAIGITSVLWVLPASGVDVLKPYQKNRLTGFLNPSQDPRGSTYNVSQSITAVGSGGFEGRGVKGATQTNLQFLPEHATDFAFASLAEQRGFLGAGFLLMLYLFVVWRGLKVIAVARDSYSAIVAGGIVFAFLFQVFVNVGMTIGIAPVTGTLVPGLTRAPAGRGRGRARGSPGGRRSPQVRDHRRAADADHRQRDPVTGAIPIVMPTLTKTWNRNANTIPPAAIARKGVSRHRDHLQPAPDDEQVEHQQEAAPRKPRCSASEANAKSVGVLGQELEVRLRGACDAAALEAAGADRGDRLRDVVGRAARVLRRVEEAGQAVLLVRLEHVHARRPAAARAPGDPERGDRAEHDEVRASGRRRRTAARRARRRRRAPSRCRAG